MNNFNDDILVSIITPSFNGGKTIKRAFDSVLNQTYNNIEYIVIDNASTDDTANIVEQYRLKFSEKGIKFSFYSEKDNGLYDAVNKGIKMASGEIIGYLCTDDEYEKECFSIVVNAYREHNFDYVYGDLKIVNSNGYEIIKKAKLRKFPSTRNWNQITTFVKSSVLKKLLFDNSTMYGDCDLMLRIRKENCKILVISKTLAVFHFGGMSTNGGIKQAFRRAKIRNQVYKKNGYQGIVLLEGYFIEIAKSIFSSLKFGK